jgi:PleD family two-component response regulator
VSHSVLICDDAIFMRTMVSDILTQAGFEVVVLLDVAQIVAHALL